MRAQPKGRVLQRNLDTHYVRLDGVIASLASEGFVGYVRAVFERDEALLFVRDGDPVACVFERGGRTAKGLDALVALLEAVKTAQAFLDVCRLDHDLLAAVLAVWHGVTTTPDGAEAPRDAAGALALAARMRMTGALAADEGAGEVLGYVADGEPLGWHRPGADEWTKAPPAGPASGWRLLHAPKASELRTIDLGALKARVLDEMQSETAAQVPWFGPRLFAVERAKRGALDPRAMPRHAFLQLAAGTADRARLLVGEARARALRAALEERAARVVDPAG